MTFLLIAVGPIAGRADKKKSFGSKFYGVLRGTTVKSMNSKFEAAFAIPTFHGRLILSFGDGRRKMFARLHALCLSFSAKKFSQDAMISETFLNVPFIIIDYIPSFSNY